MSHFLVTGFRLDDAINQIIQDNPYLEREFDQSRRPLILKVLGLVVNNSPHPDIQHIFAALAPFCSQQSPSASQVERNTSATEPAPSLSDPTASTSRDSPNTPERQRKVSHALFTSLLNDYGVQNGIRAVYTETIISITPPVFKVCVNCDGMEGQAEGRTLKDAKHLASKNLCDILGLRLH